MRSKIIEDGMISIYTYIIYDQSHIYINIPYIGYIEYEDNCDMIIYGVY